MGMRVSRRASPTPAWLPSVAVALDCAGALLLLLLPWLAGRLPTHAVSGQEASVGDAPDQPDRCPDVAVGGRR